MKHTLLAAGLAAALALGARAQDAAPAPVPAAPAAADDNAAIQWQTFDAAFAQARRDRKMLLVVVSTSWCGWCRKMKTGALADARVRKLSRQYACADVDGDANPDLLAALGVDSFPTVLMLDPSGEEVFRSHYMPPESFVRALEEHRDPATAAAAAHGPEEESQAAARVLAGGDAAAAAKMVPDAVGIIARPGVAADNRPVREAFAKAGPAVWPGLVAELSSDVLARRAAAAQLLVELTGARVAFDPFAKKEEREAQAKAWGAWVASQAKQEKDPGK